MIEETLAQLVDRFNRHAQQTPAVQDELRGVSRKIALKFTDGENFAVDLQGGQLVNLRIAPVDHPDVTITTDTETFQGLVKKEIGPMKALVTRRLAIDGSLDDKLLFRKLL